MSDPELPDPERIDIRVAKLRKLARRALDAAGVRVGGDHLIPVIVAAIQSECSAMRQLHASMILQLQERGCTMHNPHVGEDIDPMGTLALAMRLSYVDNHGDVQILLPPGDE